jgi:2-polyprenyl-3-methyl-5-hydroxy-6-metoxy-1,4-benzoquinol methylase
MSANLKKLLYNKKYSKTARPPPSDSVRVNTVAKLVGRNKRVLDVGCYDGTIGEVLAKNNNDVYGVEISIKAIKQAKLKNIEVCIVDIDRGLPFCNDVFDVVFAGEIIEHVLDVDFFLDEIKRVLAPGGYLVLTTPNLASLGRRMLLLLGKSPFIDVSLSGGAGHVRYFVKDSLVNLLKNHGFELDSCTSDVVNFNMTGTIYSTRITKLFPNLGRSLIVRAYKSASHLN